jgi:ATP-dependent RNA helicase DHX29
MIRIRQALPMASYKQTLLDTVRDNRVTIISAQTGAGKTTQCPQFLLEDALLDGRGNATQILVTQPRRVAATSVAERVSEEMCEPRLGGLVGYQIRMEAVRSAGTKLLFCTTGIVLRRLQDDRTLKGVVRPRFSRGWPIYLFARHQSFPAVPSCF